MLTVPAAEWLVSPAPFDALLFDEPFFEPLLTELLELLDSLFEAPSNY
ncbi:hypothetical protein ACPBEH_09420 [Latilactobacillus sp. 5-91]